MILKTVRLCALALLCLAAAAGSAFPDGQAPARPKESCPLQTAMHEARVLTPRLDVAAGEDGFVEMRIEPAPGNDFYVSALADVLRQPENAAVDILPGFPKLRFRADVPGEYLLEVRVTLLSKSSCGGVKARELTREKVTVTVR